ncbi:MAG TPA: hypothetical protein VFG83_19620 [Kofleriaceae bacterium]|nr:hypothetical protein [Kofleriaceae bacterium]
MNADMARRAELRRQRIVAHVAHSHAEAERWDLEFWLRLSPQQRLSALVAIVRDVAAVSPDGKVPATRWKP